MSLAVLFGKNLRRARQRQRMTLEALSTDVGIAYSYLRQIERGTRNPTLYLVERLAAALNTSAVDLLTDSDGASTGSIAKDLSAKSTP